MLEAIPTLAPRLSGVYAEPGAAAGIAAIYKARRLGVIPASASVVHVVTGNGLKVTAREIRSKQLEPMAPTTEALRRHMTTYIGSSL